MDKLIILKNQKGNFNDQIKILKKKFGEDDIPVLVPGGIWETPNSDIADRLIKMSICETPEYREIRLKTETEAALIIKESRNHEFYTITEKGNAIFKRTEIANYLLEKQHAMVSPGNKYMYIYNSNIGIYEIDYHGSAFLTELHGMFGDMMDIRERNEIIAMIFNTKKYQVHELETLWLDKRYICLRNGVYNIETKELLPHSHEYYFLTRVPVDFDAAATCPNIEIIMQNVFTADQIPGEYEWIGYSLTPGNRYKLFSVYIGATDSGRTTYFNIIGEMFGSKNAVPMEPHQVVQEFYSCDLHGKMISTCADIGRHKIRNFNRIKQACGGDPMRANVKGKSMITFVNSAKFWWAANEMPTFDDSTSAAANRLRIVECEKTISQDNQDNFDFSIYITDTELSGLLNLAIEGLHRLDERKHFILGSIDDRMEKHDVYATSMFLWAEENLDFTGAQYHRIFGEDLYESYLVWCKINDMKVIPTHKNFISTFKASFHDKYERYTKIRINGIQKRGVIGVMFFDTHVNDVIAEIEETIDEFEDLESDGFGGYFDD